MISNIPLPLIFIFSSLLVLFFRGKIKNIYLTFIPIFAGLVLLSTPDGNYLNYHFLQYSSIFFKVDKLSKVFAYAFIIICFAGIIYSYPLKENGHHIASLVYVGSSLGVVFAGDFITLFVFWEMMAFSASALIFYNKNTKSYNAGMRYLVVHLFGGVLLLLGIIMHIKETGSPLIDKIQLSSLSSYFILFAFLLNSATPPLHPWLSDAYPEATVPGAVFLSAYTTKTAVYVLCRVFPGCEMLIVFGVLQAVYGVIFAVLENDIRRLLSYHIISQVGYMVAGVGIGTTFALSGSMSHAFSHILYKGLLFMGAGCVLYQTGKSKLTDLGGIYKTMPLTLSLYMIGAFSISAFPLFSGFVSKSMVVDSSAQARLWWVWLLLTLASSGTFLHTGLKLPYFTFFGEDKKIKTKEAPLSMLVAMSILAFLCILIGIYPHLLYSLLPYPVTYQPYTAAHIVSTLQILLFTGVGFFLFLNYVGGMEKITLDTDYFYRRGGKIILKFMLTLQNVEEKIKNKLVNYFNLLVHKIFILVSFRKSSVSGITFTIVVFLLFYLLVYILGNL